MTKKRRNLKQLFLFNGLLLLIAFILIQYSVINNTEEQETTESRPLNAEDNTSLQETENIYKAVLQGSFEERLVQFDQPAIPYNISFKNILISICVFMVKFTNTIWYKKRKRPCNSGF